MQHHTTLHTQSESTNESDLKGRPPTARPMKRKGLGPFSGAHLAAMVIALIVAVAFPFAAFAVTGTNSFVTDATSGVHAKVDAKQNLATAMHDPTTGVGAKVNAFGQLATSSAVTGSVTATSNSPSEEYNFTNNANQQLPNFCANITPAVPAGKALVATSISVGVNQATTGPVDTWLEAGTPSTPCGVTAGIFIAYAIQSNPIGTMQFNLPSGVAFKAGHTVSVGIHAASGDAIADVTVHGYLVPSTQCQAAAGGPTGCY